MDFKRNLDQINNDLACKDIRLRLEKRGEKLNLRGPLPSKELQGVIKTQRISLGLPANTKGLIEAEKLLQLVLLQIKRNQFSWDNWSSKQIDGNKLSSSKKVIAESIEEFKKGFFNDPSRHKSISSSKTTWNSAYLPYLRRLKEIALDKGEKITSEVLYEALSSYSENSRSRQQCGTALGSFANYLNIKLPQSWKSMASGYGVNKAQFRQLPSDNQIIESIHLIPNSKWRLVYGLMATYGLRNHEVFFCDLSCFAKNGDNILRVLPNTKTGEHQAWPFQPEWVDFFRLKDLGESSNNLPSINTDLKQTTLQQVGRRVSEQFRRYQLPITPYDLRHAWAVRTIHIGLPDTVSARMMGHSVAIHTQTYHHWITRRDQQQAVDAALSKKIA